MPTFLANTIPAISSTLLALDISANFLVALPPCLETCFHLEELNIASNPLRVIPVFLSHLTSLRVLIADATGISTLPDSLSELDKLHTISVRRNKMNALPSWLCLLPSLQTLFVDGNPFQGPWKALVEPLLHKTPMTPAYPPSTPGLPILSASSPATIEDDLTDNENAFDPASAGGFLQSPDDEVTITPNRVALNRSVTELVVFDDTPPPSSRHRLARTRTTPSRAPRDQANVQTNRIPKSISSARLPSVEDSGYFGDLEVRKMKSAGDLRKRFNHEAPSSISNPTVPTHSRRPSSSSKVLDLSLEHPATGKRYASLGAASNLAVVSGTATHNASGSRHVQSSSLWDNISDGEVDVSNSPSPSRFSFAPKNSRGPSAKDIREDNLRRAPVDRQKSIQTRQDTKEKGSKWGFLKKMSMGRMKIDSQPSLSTRSPSLGRTRPISKHTTPISTPMIPPESASGELRRSTPQLDLRFSTTGILDSVSSQMEKSSADALKASPSATNLLVPPSVTSKAGKRRSFLPIDPPIHIPIPENSKFVPGLIASNGLDDSDHTKTPSPTASPVVDPTEQICREEDKAQESYTRALRSVMAYLKDMNDLGSSPTNCPSMYGAPVHEQGSTRSRRPTLGEGGRSVSDVSVTLSGTTAVSSPGHLRTVDSAVGLRNSNTTQTLSVATTDSNGSEERKFKDDKSKRAMVIREIVEYVRQLSLVVCG
jgi:hypothetical protein